MPERARDDVLVLRRSVSAMDLQSLIRLAHDTKDALAMSFLGAFRTDKFKDVFRGFPYKDHTLVLHWSDLTGVQIALINFSDNRRFLDSFGKADGNCPGVFVKRAGLGPDGAELEFTAMKNLYGIDQARVARPLKLVKNFAFRKVGYSMEFVTGNTLLVLKLMSALNWEMKEKVAESLTQFLKSMHLNNQAHGDLNSKNVLVNGGFDIRVIDPSVVVLGMEDFVGYFGQRFWNEIVAAAPEIVERDQGRVCVSLIDLGKMGGPLGFKPLGKVANEDRINVEQMIFDLRRSSPHLAYVFG